MNNFKVQIIKEYFMRKVIVFLFFIISAPNIFASSGIQVTYSFNVNMDEKLNELPKHIQEIIKSKLEEEVLFTLVANHDESFYFVNKEFEPETHSEYSGNTERITKTNRSYSNYYQNFRENEVLEQRLFQGQTYLIEFEREQLHWEIKEEEKEINGYLCKLATTMNNDKLIKVWFTEELEFSAGPAIYSGLPGLILEVETEGQLIQVVDLKQINSVSVNKPMEGLKITQNEMREIMEDAHGKENYEESDGNRTRIFKSYKLTN